MVARTRYSRRLVARGTMFAAALALIGAAFVALPVLPAQAQATFDFSLYPPAPSYSNCSTFSYNGFAYMSCSQPSYVYYGPPPTYDYYYSPTPYVVYNPSPYYYYGP